MAGKACCNMSSRVALMIVALVFWSCAAIMIYLTVHIFDYVGPIKHMYNVYYLTGPAGILIALSILLITVGFLGCLGACKESRCLQITFFVMLLFVLMFEITGAVLSIVYKDEVDIGIEKGMTKAIQQYSNDSNVQESWDYMQQTFKCCGVESYEDWGNTSWAKTNPNSVPVSCCNKKKEPSCSGDLSKDVEYIYQKGCHAILYDDVREYLAWIIAFAIIFALVQLFGLICTCVRIYNRRTKRGNSPYEVLGDKASSGEALARGYPA